MFALTRELEIGGWRFGITGVTDPALLLAGEGTPARAADSVCALPMVSALEPVVADLRERSDVVIVLAHAGPAACESLARATPGVNLIVVGHNPGFLLDLPVVEGTRLIRGGNRGTYLPVVTLHTDSLGLLRPPASASIFALGEWMRRDAATAARVDSFLEVTATRARRAQQAEARDSRYRAGGDRWLGAETCARCHEGIASLWGSGRHAAAFRTLVAQGQGQNSNCIPCHVTASPETPAGDDAPASAEANVARGLRGVQCEACHGRGSRHGEPDFMAPVAEVTCRRCHDAANDPDFDFAAALRAGIHSR